MENIPLLKKNESKVRNRINDLLAVNYDVNSLEIDNNLNFFESFIFYFFNYLFLIVLFPFFLLSIIISLIKVDSLEGIVVTYLGKIKKVIVKPGLHFVYPLFTKIRKINLSLQTMEITGSHVPDSNGSPLNISVVLTFKVKNPIEALFNVNNYLNFIHSQSLDVVRKVVSRFPYRVDSNKEPCILKDCFLIGLCMKELLQKKVNISGIEVIRMELMEFNYAPEIAQSLLQTQQAKAKIEARNYIVDGSVNIVKDAIEKLEKCGIILDKGEKAKIVKNWLTITCSDHGQPVPVLKV